MTGKPDLKTVMQNEGIHIKRNMAPCSFHFPDKHPSMGIKNERYHCFACGASGDVIDFIMKFKGLSFKDSLGYLGINGNKRKVKTDSREIKKRELVKEYREWLDRYTDFLCNVLRRLDIAKMKAKTMKQVEAMAFHYHTEQIWESHLEILLGKDEKAKLDIYKRIKYGK